MVRFDFTVEEVNVLLAALQELPFKSSNALITRIVQDSAVQLAPKE